MNRREAIKGALAGLAGFGVTQTQPAANPIDGVGVLVYPPGGTVADDGKLVDNEDIACRLCRQIKKGTIIAMPHAVDSYGLRMWDFRIEGGDPGQVRVERSGE